MQVAMKGAGVAATTIPTMKVKVVAAIVPTLKVEVAAPLVKAEEIAATTLAIKVEVAKKKRKVKLPKLKMSVDRHGLPSGDLHKSFDARRRSQRTNETLYGMTKINVLSKHARLSPIALAVVIDLYGQEPSAMELKKARDIGTKAFFATFDGPTSSAHVEDSSATESATDSDV
ncbi:unnamed protein product [Sphagnum troendelagicum]